MAQSNAQKIRTRASNRQCFVRLVGLWLHISVALSFSLIPNAKVPKKLVVVMPYADHNRPRIHASYRPRGRRLWQQADDFDEDEDEDEEPTGNSDLYEFLTRRQQRKPDRKRKRDYLREWITPSSSSPRPMVQPLRVEDGSVMRADEVAQGSGGRLEALLAGMPSLDEILSGKSTSSGSDEEGSLKKRIPVDNSWFDEEKEEIETDYREILEEIRSDIARERQNDPESLPDNAEGVVESIVRKELERRLESRLLERAAQRLQQAEEEKRSELDTADYKDRNDEVAERILQEAADEWNRRQKLQSQLDEYAKYEQSLRIDSVDNAALPTSDTDLDAWALQRLQEMLKDTQSREDSEVAVTDILEQNISDLKEEIEKEAKKGSIRPETMKEWQMFRAIATRLSESLPENQTVDEAEVAARLESWRMYLDEETEIRKKSGLARGPKMPFEWHEKRSGQVDIESLPESDNRSREEIRRDINRQSVGALEDLIAKSDPKRSESLKKTLEALKAELVPRDYNDVEVRPEAPTNPGGPVDLSDVLTQRKEDDEVVEKYREDFLARGEADSPIMSSPTKSSQPNTPFFAENPADSVPPPRVQERPNTPFFEGMDDGDNEEAVSPKVKPPKTPFFTDASTDRVDTENKLGSSDEQKLEAMYRRAGARTTEEKEAIKEQWESFKKIESEKRQLAGLSERKGKQGDEATSQPDSSRLKYDISEVMSEDGDVDASKILSAIGPRPKRNRKPTKVELPPDEESDLDEEQVSESLYRAVSAVGGGRSKDNPELRDREMADFEAYMQKEDALRDSLDDLDEIAKGKAESFDTPIEDDQTYAEEALSTIGPRPLVKRRKIESLDAGEYSDMGGILSSEVDDNEDDEEENDEDDEMDLEDDLGLVPRWLRKEREQQKKDSGGSTDSQFRGSDIDQVFDDDQYDHNMRQLAEYERRRAGKQRQMGIDIGAILGRGRGTDDYADYNYDADYFRNGGTNFDARKQHLLEYNELSVPELNNLMDHRDSVYATGVSQYMPRVNRPFKEFGAIFRLEGVLVDITGLHFAAWKHVASNLQLRVPELEDAKRAAVVHPQTAIREIFYWTNDIVIERQIQAEFLSVFSSLFEEWAHSEGLSGYSSKLTSAVAPSMALGADAVSEAPPVSSSPRPRPSSEAEKLELIRQAWTATAARFNYPAPTSDQILQCASLAPEIAVRAVLGWSTDLETTASIVRAYKKVIAGDSLDGNSENGGPKADPAAMVNEAKKLELQYKAWCEVARDHQMEPPTPEEVLAAAVLNNPKIVVLEAFEWTGDEDMANEMAMQFQNLLAQYINMEIHGRQYTPQSQTDSEQAKSPSHDQNEDLVAEDLMKCQLQAWERTADAYDFDPPNEEGVQLAFNLSPRDAVRRLLGWAYNFNESQINEITETYVNALHEASKEFQSIRKLASSDTSRAQEIHKKQDELPSGPSRDEIYQAAFDAWREVAWQRGLSLPESQEVEFALTVGPIEAILYGFQWTDDRAEAEEITKEYREKIGIKRQKWVKNVATMGTRSGGDQGAADDNEPEIPLVSKIAGVHDWVDSLSAVEMGCGVASFLSNHQVDVLLEYAGLSELFPPDRRVSSDDRYERDSQQLLGVALRIERRPDQCVVFDTTPFSAVAAQEVEMRSVGVVGPYARYDLLAADTSVFSFVELTAMNVRRLFGERIYDQPQMESVQIQPEQKRKVKTRFWEDGD